MMRLGETPSPVFLRNASQEESSANQGLFTQHCSANGIETSILNFSVGEIFQEGGDFT
jgi:hypothetical protein